MGSYVEHNDLLVEVQDLASGPGLDPDLQACIDGCISRLQAMLDDDQDAKLLDMIDRVQARIAWLDEELHANYDRS